MRRKKIHGKHYYQLVRNYRKDGKHRQRVLCHLGAYDSVEGAIADAKQQIALHRNASAAKRREADLIRRELQEHGHPVEETHSIYSMVKASEELRQLRWFEPERYYYRDGEEWASRMEEWEVDMELAQLKLTYQKILEEAERYEWKAHQSRRKLSKLLECQKKYCS